MRRIYHWLSQLFKPKRKRSMAEFERVMPPEIKALIEKEAAFLRARHGVMVEAVKEGEETGKPRPANPADESRLPPEATSAEPSSS